jgi:hypothetical protein
VVTFPSAGVPLRDDDVRKEEVEVSGADADPYPVPEPQSRWDFTWEEFPKPIDLPNEFRNLRSSDGTPAVAWENPNGYLWVDLDSVRGPVNSFFPPVPHWRLHCREGVVDIVWSPERWSIQFSGHNGKAVALSEKLEVLTKPAAGGKIPFAISDTVLRMMKDANWSLAVENAPAAKRKRKK